MSKAYSSNLTQSQFELIEPLIPVAKSGGRPREVEIWAVLNAIFYVLVQGCKWRDLPENFPAWQTVYTYFRQRRKNVDKALALKKDISRVSSLFVV